MRNKNSINRGGKLMLLNYLPELILATFYGMTMILLHPENTKLILISFILTMGGLTGAIELLNWINKKKDNGDKG